MGGVSIQYPYLIYGEKNLLLSDNVSIGKGATIMCTRASITIKSHFVSGPNLTIITGDHMPLLGRFIDSVTDEDKDKLDSEHLYDKAVVVEDDVWVGANVIILKGVTIGRGCIIAAGAIVTKSLPPYTICGGIPAKVLKNRYSIEEIIRHEKDLYVPDNRLTIEQIERIRINQ